MLLNTFSNFSYFKLTKLNIYTAKTPFKMNGRSLLLLVIGILLGIGSFAQKTASGTVEDSKGKPLAGATVKVVGASKAVSTNDKGKFEISNVGDNAKISVSMVGYKAIEVKAGENLIIKLVEANNTLDEVVVTGFQQINRKKFTGAGVKLKADEIKTAGVVDVSRMLEGRAAGVTVQNVSSTFGSAPKVRVRGATSINGDNKPLWVVDGVVLEDLVNISNDQLSSGDPTTLLGSSVAGINSNDIETFDILKDAAATALYGARAMNGVVVITTKKGKQGKPSIAYSVNFSTQLKPSYGEYNIMNSAEQMSTLASLERDGFLEPGALASRADYGVYGKMYDLLNGDANGNFPVVNTPQGRNAFLLRYAKANTDWFDILFRNSLTQEHSLSISSGTDKSQSFFSASYYRDNGWTIADNVKRYTLNFRNNYNISDKLSVGFLTNGSVRQQRAPGTLKRTDNVVSGQYDREFDINPFSYALNTSRAITAYDENGNLEYFRRNWAPFNIIDELKNNYIDVNVIDLKLQTDISYKITKHLRYDFVGALRYVKSTLEHQITENSNMANAYRSMGTQVIIDGNKFLYLDPDGEDPTKKISVLPYGGFYNRSEDFLTNYDVRNSLSYNNTFNDKHTIAILLGQQVKYTDRQNYNSTGYGYQYDNGGVAFPDYHILKKTIEANFPYYGMSKTYDRFVAYYLNAQYTYDRRYNIYGTVRYDGSNKLGASKTARWLPTWSFGGSWNIDQEKFFENVRKVDYMKLRASYGLTASLGPVTNSNVVLQSAVPNRFPASERESVLQLINLQNADLTWEKNHQLNIGIDAGMFNGRLDFSFDWYNRNSFDLISLIKTAGIGGEGYKAINYADMKSHGIDVMIGGTIIKKKNWNWKSNITYGYNVNKITYAKNVPIIYDLVKPEGGNREGYAVNSLFSINYQGLDHLTGIPYFINEYGKPSQGVDVQSDSVQYLLYSGTLDPKFTGGFNNTFNYKNFSLNIFITYQGGNKIRLYPAFRSSYVDFDALPKEFHDRWLEPGDEKLTYIPQISDEFYGYKVGTQSFYPYNNYNYSDKQVADGGFIRLKTVSLSYQLSSSSLKKLDFVKNLSFTAAVTNPWLIYSDKKLKGQDPEFFNAGGVAQPLQKQITLSIKAGF
ncbi:SusC/RagA family TonB-linked outer membrane protein [Ferruginibacter lapsinanis]|uniref:SusC/RagA family TonB-linked outer membrane protein n=1 Tax=Ferruginibacter lapsinanis TaxID=563172 RepID=UPI001E4A804E|nr:SusC/RagA family TonB-linked outer membrane protein [Ferruginibacter lapsinanis]UEG48504.1 SusC/RagA family TonB-linked outer membrane protein [Ferruginibacter lapsinanis]